MGYQLVCGAVEAVFKSSFGFTYVLFGALVALYHVNDVFRVTVSLQSRRFLTVISEVH